MTHDQALQALQAALATAPLAQGRSYPNHLPQGVVFPAIRWQQIGGTNALTNCETTEEGDDIRVQIDVFAIEYGVMRQLREQVISAIDAAANAPVPLPIYRAAPGGDLPFDADARVFRHSIDFIIALSN